MAGRHHADIRRVRVLSISTALARRFRPYSSPADYSAWQHGNCAAPGLPRQLVECALGLPHSQARRLERPTCGRLSRDRIVSGDAQRRDDDERPDRCSSGVQERLSECLQPLPDSDERKFFVRSQVSGVYPPVPSSLTHAYGCTPDTVTVTRPTRPRRPGRCTCDGGRERP